MVGFPFNPLKVQLLAGDLKTDIPVEARFLVRWPWETKRRSHLGGRNESSDAVILAPLHNVFLGEPHPAGHGMFFGVIYGDILERRREPELRLQQAWVVVVVGWDDLWACLKIGDFQSGTGLFLGCPTKTHPFEGVGRTSTTT